MSAQPDNTANGATANANFAVVGIGASAGGLEACKAFFHAMPADSGLAFVVIQHLDPNHESLMAEILAKTTTMPVTQVTESVTVTPNHVYLIAPNTHLTIQNRILEPIEPTAQRSLRLPVDEFFCALANDFAERAIGLIFSGTGSDGSTGVRAIKGEGGLVLVQDPETARFDGMIRSAMGTDQVDAIRAVEALPDLIVQYIRHAYVWEKEDNATDLDDHMATVLATLRTRTGYDFRPYKDATLTRRIKRRLGIKHAQTPADYIKLLRKDSQEIEQLAKDMLISVTTFFRDPEAFKALTERVLMPLVQAKGVDDPIRVWVPGCATGEEAYSLAILLLEQVKSAQKHCPLQVFATDIDQNALTIGRNGIYPASQVADVSPERRKRFFHQEDGHIHVIKTLREAVTFAQQNLMSDPPFSRLDLISCRNLLIYLKPAIQRKVIALFHFALKADGHLFLGSAETIGSQHELFEPISKTWRLYQRSAALPSQQLDFPVTTSFGKSSQRTSDEVEAKPPLNRLADVTQQLLLQHYAPAAVLINRHFQILYFYGPTDRFLKQPTGTPTDDLLARAREGLSARLRTALQTTLETGQPITVNDARMACEEGYKPIGFSIRPTPLFKSHRDALLVTFEDQHSEPALPLASETAEESVVKLLENELKTTREELQSNLEEQETTNEELKAANEEVTSINEELQSTNEELETAKEELQSMNEELTTVNSQLQDKVNELTISNSDLANLLRSTDIATLFLDLRLGIKRFTPASRALFKLIVTDVGRPLSDITAIVNDPSLLTDAEQVLDKLTTLEKEVFTKDNHCYLRRVLPYRTQDERIDGVVITYVDMTERRRGEEGLRRLATIMRDSNDAITVQDFDGKILAWNRGAERMYGWRQEEALTTLNGFDLIPAEKHPETVNTIQRLRGGNTVASFETQRLTKDGRTLDVWLTATVLYDKKGQPDAIATTERDISDQKRNEATLVTLKEAAEQANAAKSRFLAAASHDLRQPLQTLDTLQAVLAQQNKDPTLQNVIQDLGHTIRSMGSMLNILLDVNQLEVGTITPQPRSLPIAPLLTQLDKDFQPMAQNKGLQLRIKSYPAVIRSDPDLLQQILRNLVANAIKYTKKGKILVGCRRRGDTLDIQVWDTGIGIPEEHLQDIFEEFYQLTNSARDRRQGLGLGLAIVQRLSYLLNHPMAVQSRPGCGSVFTLSVPLSVETSQQSPKPSAKPSTEKHTGSVSILFIEDDAALLRAGELFLKMHDFQVTPAATSFEAFKVIEADKLRPDLVISDYRLPCGVSGLEVVEHIRQLLAFKVPAIIMTGDTTGDWAEEAQQRGYQVLQKPVDSSVLLQTIHEQLAQTDAMPTSDRD